MFKFAILAAGTVIALLSASAEAWEYRNPEFGFRVQVPDYLHACPRQPHEHNDGFLVFLDGQPGDCMEKDRRRTLALFANYNAMALTSPEGQAPTICPTSVSIESGGWMLGGRPVQACRTDNQNGWTDLLVFAFSTERISAETGTIPAILYTGYLRTPTESLTADIPSLRLLLNNVTLFQPE